MQTASYCLLFTPPPLQDSALFIFASQSFTEYEGKEAPEAFCNSC